MLIQNPPGISEEINIIIHENGPIGVVLCQLHQSGSVVIEAFSDQKGPVSESQKVYPGDCLIAINELPIELMTFTSVMEMIRTSPRPLMLTFVKGGKNLQEELKRYLNEKAMMIQKKENERRRNEDAQRMQILMSPSTKSLDPKVVVTVSNDGETEELLQVRTYNANDIRAPRVLSQFQRRLLVILGLLLLIIFISTKMEEDRDEMIDRQEQSILYQEGHVHGVASTNTSIPEAGDVNPSGR